MALTFPSSPTNGQVYTDTNTGYRYIFNSNTSAWTFSSNNVGMSISSTPPSNVGAGSMWFNREIGRTFVYYNDGDSSQWVETVPAGSIDTSTIASYVNPIYASLNTNWTYTNTAYTFANIAVNTANTAFPNTPNVSYNGSFNVPNGSISIGTNSYPLGKFQATTANGEILRLTATGATGGYQVFYFDNVTPWYLGSSKATNGGNINDLYLGSGYGTTNNLIFGTAGTERLRINSDGVFASSINTSNIITSSIKTANIVNSTGSVVFVNGYPRQPGQIIEMLTSPCDGSTVIGASGSYTWPNVTTSQTPGDTFEVVTGSSLLYTPPSGTTKIKYDFSFSWVYSSSGPILHFSLYVDTNEIVYARRNYATEGTSYPEIGGYYSYTLNIGGSDNFNSGRLASWTTAKTIKLMMRRYSSSYAGSIHGTGNWNGAGGNVLLMPTLTITAIA